MSIEDQIREDALMCYPQECVGYVSKGEYHPLDNVSPRPEENFRLTLADKFFLMGLQERGELEALVHSHPGMDNNPSEVDMEAHLATGYNYFIIGTDGKDTTEIRRIMYEETDS